MATKIHATKKINVSMRKSKGKLKKNIETKDNEDKTIQELCDAAKAVFRWKFIVMQAFLKKRRKISN